ncbi:TIGR03621 family F420-dependent LLM class oxidoreductase [Actinoallomurus sp. CA-150999]|uniref:TIGR03621 family F420-dependent LLM class oxidoreductase n=1 Tax=Actinoallomurus sp. CA-150999 TaxID=3239887 RepID=UPI003D8A6EC4
MRDFRFGFTLGNVPSYRQLADTMATAEGYGFDIALAVEHLGTGRTSPFQGLLAAATTTDRLRIGTYVLNNGYWNPTILAREVATAARLSGGRFELGLGAGIVKEQYDAARIPWHAFGERMDGLAATIEEVDALLALEEDVERPPLLLGGASERALRLAAERADIASFGGRFQLPGEPPGTMRIIKADEADRRVEFFREIAGSRADEMEWNAFVLVVEVTDDRRAVAERIAAEKVPYLQLDDVRDALESPFMLIGTEEEIARRILENRERYGFSYICVQRPHMDVLGPIIKRVRDLA